MATAPLLYGPYGAPLDLSARVGASDPSGARSVRKARSGGAGTRISAGQIADTDPNTEVRGPLWYGEPGRIGIADKMLRDPHTRQSLEYLIAPLCAADWRFKPASESEIDKEIADFCTWVFFQRLPWDQILRRITRGYLARGFDLSEVLEETAELPEDRFPNHPGGGQGVVVSDFEERPAWTVYRWEQSKRHPSRLDAVVQHIQGSDQESPGFLRVAADRLLRLTWDQDGANYEGLAVLRSAYQPWKLKMAFLSIDAIKHERLGVGVPIMTLSEEATQEDIEAAQVLLEEMRAHEKGYLTLPNGYEFEWSGSTGDKGTDINLAIERCNKDIAINVAAGFMLLGLTGGPGSYNLASSQQGQYHLGVTGHARFVLAGLNCGQDGWSPIERIVRLNYGPKAAIPVAIARNLPSRNWIEIVDRVIRAVQAGAMHKDPNLEGFLRDILQVPDIDPDFLSKLEKMRENIPPLMQSSPDGSETEENEPETEENEPEEALTDE